MVLGLSDHCMQDLTAYKKYKEKAVASAARSLITLFREIAPYMLEKKDRGRGADLEARPMQYGAGTVRVSLPCFDNTNAMYSLLPVEVHVTHSVLLKLFHQLDRQCSQDFRLDMICVCHTSQAASPV